MSEKYGSLRYVDHLGDNFLFRGPTPCVTPPDQPGTIYDYGGLTAAMLAATPSELSLPDNYMLMNFCLQYDNEQPDVATILEFFQHHTNIGAVRRVNDVYGTPNCYFKTDPPLRQDLLNTFDSWLDEHLIASVDTIRGWLDSSPFPAPVIVYVHCEGGCDRTAEIIGAYMLRYMGTSWSDLSNIQPCASPGQQRPLGCNNYRALQWYAFWLNEKMGFSITDIGIDNGCVDPDPGQHWPCSPVTAAEIIKAGAGADSPRQPRP